MKNTFFILVALFLTFGAFAQEVEVLEYPEEKQEKKDEIKTILKKGGNGGFIDVSLQHSFINQRDGMYIGSKFGWIMNHSLAMGFGGYGFFNETRPNTLLGGDYNLAGGYGGFFMEPIILPKFPVHISIPLFFGIGGVSYIHEDAYNDDDWDNDWDDDDFHNHDYVEDSDMFMIFKPGVELELNVTKHFRLGFGAYYPLTTDINLTADIDPSSEINNVSLVNKDVLSNWTFGMTMKFGKF